MKYTRVLTAALAGLIVLWVGLLFSLAPDFEAVKSEFHPSDRLLLDRDGRILHELRVNPEIRRLTWVPLDQVSPALVRATVEGEDRRFFSHHGIDVVAGAGAGLDWLSGSSVRGASTITMQLAGFLFESLQRRGRFRSWLQKGGQAGAALLIEQRWTKAEILEAYLNLVSFRGELQGISAASRGLFGKVPHGLSNAESVVLAALIRSPNSGRDQVARRAHDLADRLHLNADEMALEPALDSLSGQYWIQQRVQRAPHVARRLFVADPDGAVNAVRSTLAWDIQLFADESLRGHVLRLSSQNVGDGAVVVADLETGQVLAYVGNTGAGSSARHVDGVQALRQAGSVLKPFLYARALDRRILTLASYLEDRPVEIQVAGGLYRPENYDHQFRGPVTARTALASSLNIPAVRVLEMVGVEDFMGVLAKLGFSPLRRPEYYGPSLALGAVEVSLWDLVRAYLLLGRLGSGIDLTLQEAASSPSGSPLSPGACFLVAQALSDREGRSGTFGLESPLATPFWTAVKTGTSKDMRDNWCVGFSSRFVVGVWVGNFSGESMWNVSGISGAAPVWLEIMEYLHRNDASVAPEAPAGVERRDVMRVGELIRSEWFLTGTAPERVRLVRLESRPRIQYPSQGTVFAADPDIPPDRQLIFFESIPVSTESNWELDGTLLGSADRPFPWTPREGRHELSLRLKSGEVQDSVVFFVRGSVPVGASR
jgi:penicillin-binding protein 1C